MRSLTSKKEKKTDHSGIVPGDIVTIVDASSYDAVLYAEPWITGNNIESIKTHLGRLLPGDLTLVISVVEFDRDVVPKRRSNSVGKTALVLTQRGTLACIDDVKSLTRVLR